MPRLYEEMPDDIDLYEEGQPDLNGEEAHIHFVLRDFEELIVMHGAEMILRRLDEDTVADLWTAFAD